MHELSIFRQLNVLHGQCSQVRSALSTFGRFVQATDHFVHRFVLNTFQCIERTMNPSQMTETLSDDMKELDLETKVKKCMTDG